MRVLDSLPRTRALATQLMQDRVARNGTYIMLSTIATSFLGYVYWIVVVRTSGPEVSGVGAAATSALMAAALTSSVGAAAAMVEWLPRVQSAHEWRRRITVGIGVAATAGVIAGVVGALLLGWTTGTLPELRRPLGFVWFCTGTAAFAVGTVVDYAAVAGQRGGLLLMRNVLFTTARIPVLFIPVLVWRSNDEVLASWAIAAVLSLVVAAARFESHVGRSLRPTLGHLRQDFKDMASSLVGQHFITIAAMLAAYLLPVLVVARLDATHTSYFYATWMLCAVFFMISPAISTALFAEAAFRPETVPTIAMRAAKLIGALLVVPMALYLGAGGLLLNLFGGQYAANGRVLLVLLTISAVPDAITNIAVALLRATRRIAAAFWLNASMLAGCLALSWLLLPHFGIAAVGLAWLASQTAGAVWVGVAWRRIVHPAPAPSPAHGVRA